MKQLSVFSLTLTAAMIITLPERDSGRSSTLQPPGRILTAWKLCASEQFPRPRFQRYLSLHHLVNKRVFHNALQEKRGRGDVLLFMKTQCDSPERQTVTPLRRPRRSAGFTPRRVALAPALSGTQKQRQQRESPPQRMLNGQGATDCAARVLRQCQKKCLRPILSCSREQTWHTSSKSTTA